MPLKDLILDGITFPPEVEGDVIAIEIKEGKTERYAVVIVDPGF